MAVILQKSCYFACLKLLVLLNLMTAQLFARYRKLTTYMSVAPISSDILVYAFFFQSGSLGKCSLYFPCIIVI